MHPVIVQTVRSLVELASGRRCVGCGLPAAVWCEQCLRRSLDVHACRTPRGITVHAAARYTGSVRDAIVAHKEGGQLSLVTPLARLLAAAVVAGAAPGDCPVVVVPVPSQPAAVRARGQDHTKRLAAATTRGCHGSVVTPLRWTRRVADQSGLGVQHRRVNVAGAMRARAASTGHPVWLVDDILTTGSTVDEAVRALTSAGWTMAGVAVVASVESRSALAGAAGLR